MLSEPFTTQDGDVILRAGSDPDPKHDFRVHKVVLSLASRVFKDLFLTAQPDDSQGDPLPAITMTDPPESVDLFLRFIYPGFLPPTITDPTKLSALLTIADKYDIPTISSLIKRRLADEEILTKDPFGVYVIARSWGFTDEAKGAARMVTLADIMDSPFSGDLKNPAKEDFFRLLWFMQKRGVEANMTIRSSFTRRWVNDAELELFTCKHANEEAREFFRGLAEEIIEEFDADPCMGRWEMVEVLRRSKDPPHTGFCDDDDELHPEREYFEIYCPLRPPNIVNALESLASELEAVCKRCLNEAMDGECPV